MTNDLHRALDAVADGPTPDFIARLAEDVDREMNRTTIDAVSNDLDLQENPGDLGQHARRNRRTIAASLATVAVIAGAVALARPFGNSSTIRTGTTATLAPIVIPTSAPSPSRTPVASTTPNEPTALAVPSTPTEWEAMPSAPLARTEHPLVIAMGNEVLVVGGINRQDRVLGGAIFDGTSWRAISNAPSVLTDSVPAVWTGSAVVAIGDDGNVVAFTPGADQWKVLSKEATTPRSDATAVWSGSELLVAGGTDPRITPTAGEGTPLLEAAAFNPATRSWRTLPAPPGNSPLLGPSAWVGTEWIRAAAPVKGQPDSTKVAAFNPESNRWRPLPDLWGQASALVPIGSSLAIYSQDPFGAVRSHFADDALAYDTTVPTFEQTTIKNAFVVAGTEIATGYLTIAYRQAGGGWGWIPNPISLAGDERYVQTANGNFIAYASGRAARLRPISDPTVSLQRCDGRYFSSTIEAGPDDATFVLINTGPACTFNQVDDHNVQFLVLNDWVDRVENRQLTGGGLGYTVEPKGRVTVSFARADLPVYPQRCVSPPPNTDPIYQVRFTLSAGTEPVELKVAVPTGCVALTFSVVPPRPPEPPPTTTTLPPIPSDRWEALPDTPMKATNKPLVVTLGKDVLVVGGYGPFHSDQVPKTAGAIFGGQQWRTIPDAPVPLAGEMSAVWTGSNLLVVSDQGKILTFTPGPDEWKVIGEAPQPYRIGAQVAWTGDEMLLASGGLPAIAELEGGTNVIEDAVAYRPATGTWRTLPRPPTKDPLTGKSVWTGDEWVRTAGLTEGKFDGFGLIAAYDPANDRWRELPQLDVAEPPLAILLERDALVVYTSTERRRLAGETWQGAGAIPPFSGYGSSTSGAWFVGGQAVKAGYDNYNNFEVLDTNGAWRPLGDPFPSPGVDAVVKTADDRLIAITGGKAARLRLP
jgi:hypothetical protein